MLHETWPCWEARQQTLLIAKSPQWKPVCNVEGRLRPPHVAMRPRPCLAMRTRTNTPTLRICCQVCRQGRRDQNACWSSTGRDLPAEVAVCRHRLHQWRARERRRRCGGAHRHGLGARSCVGCAAVHFQCWIRRAAHLGFAASCQVPRTDCASEHGHHGRRGEWAGRGGAGLTPKWPGMHPKPNSEP